MSHPTKMDENIMPEQKMQTDVPPTVSDLDNNSKDSPTKASLENVSKEDWLDILGNGQLKKRVIRKGEENYQPHRGDVCVLKVCGTLDDGKIVEDYEDMSIQLGDLEIIQGLDLTIKLMDKGEIAEVLVHPRFAYGTRGNGYIPPNATIRYTVELKEIICQPEIELLSIRQRKEIGNKKRERGNWWFIRKDFYYATECYRRALQYLQLNDGKQIWNGSKQNEPVSDAELQDILDDSIKVYNNLAAALIETEAYNAALENVDLVLKYQPKNAKALYRKGKIHKIKGEYSKAYMTFLDALKIEPEMRALQIELTGLKEKMSEEFEKEKYLYAKMLGMKKDKVSKNVKVEDKSKIAKGILWTLLGASAAIVGILVHRFIS